MYFCATVNLLSGLLGEKWLVCVLVVTGLLLVTNFLRPLLPVQIAKEANIQDEN